MATSSITHNFVISSPNSVKRFIAAIAEADRDRTPKQTLPRLSVDKPTRNLSFNVKVEKANSWILKFFNKKSSKTIDISLSLRRFFFKTCSCLLLENVVVQAINTLLGDKSTYQAQLQQNIAKVIRSAQQNTADGIDEKLQELQKELLKKANHKEAYDKIADEIFKLREQREKCTVDTAVRGEQIARINELQDFIKQQPTHLEAFDETLVKRWLERIIIWDDHFTVDLKSGLKIDIEG